MGALQLHSISPSLHVCLEPEPSCVHHNPSRALGDLNISQSSPIGKLILKFWHQRVQVKLQNWFVGFVCLVTSFTGSLNLICFFFFRRDGIITHRTFCGVLTKEATGGLSFPTVAENPCLESDPQASSACSSSFSRPSSPFSIRLMRYRQSRPFRKKENWRRFRILALDIHFGASLAIVSLHRVYPRPITC